MVSNISSEVKVLCSHTDCELKAPQRMTVVADKLYVIDGNNKVLIFVIKGMYIYNATLDILFGIFVLNVCLKKPI